MRFQKSLCLALVTLLLVSSFTFAVGDVFSNEVSETEQEIILEGSGTPGDPYMIYDVYDLQNMSADLTAHYALANDIDANGTSGWNWNGSAYNGFVPIGDYYNRFTGSLDGNSYTITGLYIDRPSTYYIGLFGYVDTGGEICNVGLIDVNVSGYRRVGGLVGYNNRGTVSNSYATGNVSGGRSVGGLVGWNYYGTVNNSYATGYVSSGGFYAGGLVGLNDGGTVSDSYATGNVSGNDYVGGLAGWNYGTVSNSYARVDVTRLSGSTNTDIGGFVGSNYRGKIFNCYSTGSVLFEDAADPTDKGFAGSVDTGGDFEMCGNFWDVDTSEQNDTSGNATGKNTAEMMTQSTFTDAGWDFNNTWHMLENVTYPLFQWQELPFGEGTLENPYMIYDVHDLQNMSANLTAHYALANDIDASETCGWNWNETLIIYDGFEPIGDYDNRFTGSLDGNSYTITGLYINRPSTYYIGLFGYVGSGGEVRNVGVVDADVSGDRYVGGLVGWNYGTVYNSYATGTVSGDVYVGGLVGFNQDTVNNSYATGYVSSGNFYAGGLVGYNYYGTVNNSYATGNASGTGQRVGGLVGYNYYGTVSNSYATGNVSGYGSLGGLVGEKYWGTVSNSYATGDVSGDSRVGGLVGYNYYGTVSNSYSTANVSGNDEIGGLVGQNSGTVSNSFYDLETTGQSDTGKGEPKTTAEMMTQSTFTNATWDFDNTWHMAEGITYPLFQWQPLPEEASISLNLYAYPESEGWNFVSFNIDMVDTSLESILADIDGSYDRLMYYDASADQWSSYVPGRAEHFNNLQSWDKTISIWIKLSTNTTLNLTGYVPTSTEITLYPGWNMVGYPSETNRIASDVLPSEVSKIGIFNASREYNLEYIYELSNYTMTSGEGYWIYNDADYNVVWTVDY